MALQGSGLFGGFDLEDATYLRQLSSALDYWVSGGRDLSNVRIKDLTTHQRSGVEMINQRMEHSPLLKEIITPFLSVPRLENSLLVTAGRDLIDFAVPGAYEPRSTAYAEVDTAWRNRKPLPMPLNINPHHPAVVQAAVREAEERNRRQKVARGGDVVSGAEPHDDIDPEKERRNNEKQKESRADRLARAAAAAAEDYVSPLTGAPLRVYTGPREYQSGRQLRLRQQHLENSPIRGEKDVVKVDQKLALALNKELNRPKGRLINKQRNTLADSKTGNVLGGFRNPILDDIERLDGDVARYEREQEDKKSDYDLRSNALSQESTPPRRAAKEVVTSGSGHRPRKPRGYKAVDDGTLDREPAEVGVEDPSKLILDYNTIRDDSGQSTLGIRVPNRYPHTVDFNSAVSVKKLNTWRSQILGRNFPASRKTREHWLQIEKQLVLDLVKSQLQTRPSIKWNKLANAFNRTMAGTTQHAGDKYCARGTRILDALEEDRAAPWRTKSSIQGMCFKWTEYKTLLDAAIPEVEIGSDGEMVEEVLLNGNSNTVIDSDDEDEMPDPHPKPPTVVKKRRRSATGSPSKKKKTSTTKSKSKSRSATHRVKRRKVEESEEEDETEETEDEFEGDGDDSEDEEQAGSDPNSLPAISDSGSGLVFPGLRV